RPGEAVGEVGDGGGVTPFGGGEDLGQLRAGHRVRVVGGPLAGAHDEVVGDGGRGVSALVAPRRLPQIRPTKLARSVLQRSAASRPAATTSSWASGLSLMPAAWFVTRETPRTSRPASRAATASSDVLIPTRSAPRTPAIRTSAGVS